MDHEHQYVSVQDDAYEEIDVIQTEVSIEDMPGRGRIFEKIITFFSLGFLIFLPLFILPFSDIVIEYGKSIFLAFGVLLLSAFLVLSWLKTKTVTLSRNLALRVLPILPFWYFVCALFSGSFGQSFFGSGESGTALMVLVFTLLAFVVSLSFDTQQKALRAFIAIFLSGAFVLFFQFIHLLIPGITSLGGVLPDKVSNLVGSWTDFGIYSGLLMILSLVAVAVFSEARARFMWFVYTVFGFAFFFHLAAIYSGSWVLIAIISSSVAIWSFLSERKEKGADAVHSSKTPLFMSTGVAIVSLILIFTQSFVNVKLFELFQIPPNTEVRPSWVGTFEIAKDSVVSNGKNAILGVGPNRFFIQWNKFHPVGVNESPWWSVDFNTGVGFIPSSPVTVGVVGFLFWIIFLAVFFFAGIWTLKKHFSKMEIFSKYLALSTFLGASFLWVVMFVNATGNVVTALAFILTGLFVAVLSNEGISSTRHIAYTKDSRLGITPIVLLLVVLGLIVALSYGIISRTRSVLAYRQAVMASLSGNLDTAETQMNRALKFAKTDNYYRSYSVLSTYRSQQILQRSDLTPDDIRLQWSAMFRSSVENAKNATLVDPLNYTNWVALGNTYAGLVPLKLEGVSKDAYDNAKVNYEKAKMLAPKNPGVPFVLAQLNISAGNQEEALANLKDTLALKGNYVEALAVFAQIEVDSGNASEALPYLEKAVQIEPSNSVILFQLGFVRFKMGDWKGAVSVLENAVAITPSYSNAKYFLGLSYSKLGRVSEAIKQFEDVKTMNPDREDITAILKNLKNGLPPLTPSSSTVGPKLDAEE